MIFPALLWAVPPEPYSDNLYLRIGVFPNASYEEIMSEAEKLMSMYRQKIIDSGAKPEVYYKLREAYTTLSDPTKRAAYDNKIRNRHRFEGNPPENWSARVTEFCEENDPAETYDIVQGLPPIPLAEIVEGRPGVIEKPLKPSEVLEEMEKGRVSTAKFGRTGVLVRHSTYLAFLGDASSTFFLEGRRPKALEGVFEALVAVARTGTFPGLLLAGVSLPAGLHAASDGLTVESHFAFFAATTFAGLEIVPRFLVHKKTLPRAYRHLMTFLKDKRYGRLKSDDRPHYTELANNLILIDLWIEVLFPQILEKQQFPDFSNPHVNYPHLYERRWPLWTSTMFLIKFYPELAPALLFRFLQNRPNTLFLERVMREDPDFWIEASEKLKPALNEQKAGELATEFEELRKRVKVLAQARRSRFARAIDWTRNAPSRCISYFKHIAFVAKTFVVRP